MYEDAFLYIALMLYFLYPIAFAALKKERRRGTHRCCCTWSKYCYVYSVPCHLFAGACLDTARCANNG